MMTAKQKQTLDTLNKWCYIAIAEDEPELWYAAQSIADDWQWVGIVEPNGDLTENENITIDEWNEIADLAYHSNG